MASGIELVLADVDGTLVTDDKQLTERTVAADFQKLVIEYIDRRFGHGGAGRTAAE